MRCLSPSWSFFKFFSRITNHESRITLVKLGASLATLILISLPQSAAIAQEPPHRSITWIDRCTRKHSHNLRSGTPIVPRDRFEPRCHSGEPSGGEWRDAVGGSLQDHLIADSDRIVTRSEGDGGQFSQCWLHQY